MENVLESVWEVFIGKGGQFYKSLFPVGEEAWGKFELANICKPFILVIKVRWVLEGIFFPKYGKFLQFEGRNIWNFVWGN